MSSIKKIASQANAQKSTDARTHERHRGSAANATKHGLFAKHTPVREEDRAVFEEFSRKIHADLQPQGPSETFYVKHLIDQCWRLRCCMKIETDLFEWYRVYQEAKGGVGVAFAHDASQANCFARLSRYSRFERGLLKDLAELRILQARRSRPSAQAQDPVQLGNPGDSNSPAPNSATTTQLAVPVTPQVTQPRVEPSPVHRPVDAPLGILTDQVLLSDEDPSQFHAYTHSLFAEWQPQGATRALFVELFAVTSWRLARLSRVEAGLYEQYRFYENADGGLLTAFVQDAAQLDCFSKLAAYETRLRYSLSKILKELLG